MEKIWKRFGMLLVAALILACFIDLPAKAAEDEYTYTIRFFAGQHGVFAENGKDIIVYENKKPGDTVRFSQDMVNLSNDSKYYIMGIRESGKDNNTVSDPYFEVKQDMDYVVAYGIRGNMVAYTVIYEDADGNELAPPDTYYGNVGDKPVVAFLYIDGYLPQAYNLTKTLDANAANNVFRFIYTPLGEGQTIETVTRTVIPGTTRTTTVEEIPGTVGGTTVTVIDDGVTADAGAAGGAAAGAGAGAAADGVAINEPAVPLDTIDLDNMTDDGVYIEEPTVPLADMNLQLGPVEVDARRILITLVIVTAVGAIGASSYWYWRPYWKKEKNNEKNVARSM